jgi:hypothetical protein
MYQIYHIAPKKSFCQQQLNSITETRSNREVHTVLGCIQQEYLCGSLRVHVVYTQCEYESRQRDITCPSPPSVTVCPARGTCPTVQASSTGRDIVRNASTPCYTGAEQTSLLLCLLIHLIRRRRGVSGEMKKKCGVNVMTLSLKVNKVIYCSCYCHDRPKSFKGQKCEIYEKI